MPDTPDSPETPESAPDSPEKAPLNEQLADLVVKVIRPGGITCGGVGAVWFLLIQSDVPKAIASAVIGVGLSYGAKLLQPLHEGNQRRLASFGKTLDTAVDQAIADGKTLVTQPQKRFEDQYLERQVYDCQAVRADGIAQQPGIFTPLLKEVFVPLELVPNAVSPGLRQAVFDRFLTTLDIWALLARTTNEPMFRQLVILAWGGYGKTTLLKHIAYLYGTRQQPRSAPKLIPFLLVLRKYRDRLSQDNPPSLPDLITQHHVPDLPGEMTVPIPSDWATGVLRRGEALIMLDGFDEVAQAQRPAIARWINEQMRRYSKSVFIVTTRPKAYQEQQGTERLELTTSLWVKDLNTEQRQDLIEKWYQCQERYANGGRTTPDVNQLAMQQATDLLTQIEARQELQDLAKNPLLLNMIVTFHRRYPGAELPKRRVELYREMCLLQLRDRPQARRLETLLTQCDAQMILQQLALVMMQQRQERLERPQLLPILTQILQEQHETVETAAFLEQVVQISELLVEREPDEFEFAHLSFQEYLAATEIVRQNRERDLYPYFQDDWWKPTILLYAAQVNPTRLIETAIHQGATDLAYRCWQDTTKRVDPALAAQLAALKGTVQHSRYAQLENYLKAQQWKEADEETYRLMITAVGKEEGQWLEPEALRNFPCEDLKAIDGLWVQYSNGHFGFSVQKQIYVECGGTLDGEYPSDEVWKKFGDRVGWRKDGNWLSYDELQPSLSSPRGIFPFFPFDEGVGGFLGWWLGGGWGVCLFSRTETCRL